MDSPLQSNLSVLTHQSDRLSISDFIKLLTEQFPGKVTFSTSFSYEDQVIAHEILSNQLPVNIFTLDTGRLPQETYDLMQQVTERYGIRIPVYFPDAAAVEAYVAQNGPNAFYDSVDLRKKCCHIRKVEPLKRALRGKRAWITGLRRDQAPTRKGLVESEFDAETQALLYQWYLDGYVYVEDIEAG